MRGKTERLFCILVTAGVAMAAVASVSLISGFGFLAGVILGLASTIVDLGLVAGIVSSLLRVPQTGLMTALVRSIVLTSALIIQLTFPSLAVRVFDRHFFQQHQTAYETVVSARELQEAPNGRKVNLPPQFRHLGQDGRAEIIVVGGTRNVMFRIRSRAPFAGEYYVHSEAGGTDFDKLPGFKVERIEGDWYYVKEE